MGAAVLAAPVAPAPAWVGAALVGGAALADLIGWPPVASVRRQVPQAWSRLFAPVTVAGLYGARLGVGPLTVLNTWLWWAALAAGALAGLGAAVAAGAAFGLVRAATTVAAGEWMAGAGVTGGGAVEGVARTDRLVRAGPRAARVGGALAALAASAGAVLG